MLKACTISSIIILFVITIFKEPAFFIVLLKAGVCLSGISLPGVHKVSQSSIESAPSCEPINRIKSSCVPVNVLSSEQAELLLTKKDTRGCFQKVLRFKKHN